MMVRAASCLVVAVVVEVGGVAGGGGVVRSVFCRIATAAEPQFATVFAHSVLQAEAGDIAYHWDQGV